jgi:hypothetical protein
LLNTTVSCAVENKPAVISTIDINSALVMYCNFGQSYF